jgi:N-acetyl-anhydromuramyl-L-alanine amidase AmpD
MSVLDRIKLVGFPDSQYVKKETDKTMIHIHHTAGSSSPYDVVSYWENTPERVATHFVIAGPPPKGVTAWQDGQIIQVYSTKYWGYHLGLKAENLPAGSKSTEYLNSAAIGIELCNWGQLAKTVDGKFKTWSGSYVPADAVSELNYRGFKYYHTYSEKQLQSLKELLQFLGDKWKIPLTFKGMEMFDLSLRAFKGEPGIWTHTSYRKDKVDCPPQPALVEMLRSL